MESGERDRSKKGREGRMQWLLARGAGVDGVDGEGERKGEREMCVAMEMVCQGRARN